MPVGITTVAVAALADLRADWTADSEQLAAFIVCALARSENSRIRTTTNKKDIVTRVMGTVPLLDHKRNLYHVLFSSARDRINCPEGQCWESATPVPEQCTRRLLSDLKEPVALKRSTHRHLEYLSVSSLVIFLERVGNALRSTGICPKTARP